MTQPKVRIAIEWDPETNKCQVNAPVGDELQKKLSINILLASMNIVNNYEPQKVIVAQEVPS
jgi:hypothetical protein